MSIPVVWLNNERMSFGCCNLLNSMLDRYPVTHFTHMSFPTDLDGAVLVFHGGGACGTVIPEQVNRLVAPWKWCIFVSVGDEATAFPYTTLTHSNSRRWIQAPLPTTKADRYLVQGYPAHTQRREVGGRDVDFFFSGQDTHERRHACIAAIKDCKTRGLVGSVVGTAGFGQGMLHEDFCKWMSRAKMAPCPAGPSTPDTFRVYEALECGAIPILDAVSLRPETRGVWPLLLGDHPLPIIDDWSTLPDVMAQWLDGWELKQRWISLWWRAYKNSFASWLAYDLLSLGVSHGRREEESPRAAATT